MTEPNHVKNMLEEIHFIKKTELKVTFFKIDNMNINTFYFISSKDYHQTYQLLHFSLIKFNNSNL